MYIYIYIFVWGVRVGVGMYSVYPVYTVRKFEWSENTFGQAHLMSCRWIPRLSPVIFHWKWFLCNHISTYAVMTLLTLSIPMKSLSISSKYNFSDFSSAMFCKLLMSSQCRSLGPFLLCKPPDTKVPLRGILGELMCACGRSAPRYFLSYSPTR